MDVIRKEEKKLSNEKDLFSQTMVHYIHLKIKDIEKQGNKMREVIEDTSWLNKLDGVVRDSFHARAKNTIAYICEKIKKQNELTDVCEDFGEYLVSMTAMESLETHYNHQKMPLGELLGMKKTGNPGFDFFTVSNNLFLVFGEAKFGSKSTPYVKAVTQLITLLNEDKHIMTLTDIEHFVDDKRVIENKSRGLSAAFSINMKKNDQILNKILKRIDFQELILGSGASYPEIYLIGVEIGD